MVIFGSDVSGFGIPVAPSLSTFWVNLGGYFSSSFFIPREEVLFHFVSVLVVSSIAARLLKFVLFYRMVRASMPPPENPMLGEALAAVAQGTAAIMQLLQNQGGQRGDRPQHTTLQQFLAISPPRFAEARDPLEADDWLAEIKKHFTANAVRPEDYVTFASFQLQGAAGSWYSTYKENKGDAAITWDEFVKDFRAAHIPSGLIERKREEFLALRQGDRSVQEYNLAFVRLARYAPEEVSTYAKRIARFRRGLATDIKYALTLSNPRLFSEFVDQAIRQESAEAERSAEKRKQREYSSSAMVHKKAKAWVPDPQPQGQQKIKFFQENN